MEELEKKSLWQHTQHRWFRAEQRDSWEKGPQRPAAPSGKEFGDGGPRVGGHGAGRQPCGSPRAVHLSQPVSHAELSHALAGSRIDYGLALPAAEPSLSWPAPELVPWEGPSCCPPIAGGSPPPTCLIPSRRAPSSPELRPPASARPCPLLGAGSPGEGQRRGFGLRNNRMRSWLRVLEVRGSGQGGEAGGASRSVLCMAKPPASPPAASSPFPALLPQMMG